MNVHLILPLIWFSSSCENYLFVMEDAWIVTLWFCDATEPLASNGFRPARSVGHVSETLNCQRFLYFFSINTQRWGHKAANNICSCVGQFVNQQRAELWTQLQKKKICCSETANEKVFVVGCWVKGYGDMRSCKVGRQSGCDKQEVNIKLGLEENHLFLCFCFCFLALLELIPLISASKPIIVQSAAYVRLLCGRTAGA